MDIIILVLLVM